MHAAVAFFFLVLFLAIGDFVSEKTKAFIPSLFVFMVLLLAGAWSGFLPQNVIELGGFSPQLTDMIIVVIVVNMGCSLSFSDMKSEWKTVIIGVAGIVGVAATVLTIGTAVFGWDYAAAAAPPISGGIVAAYEMSQAALEKGLPAVSAIALMILSLQSIPAYIIVPTLLKREAKRSLTFRVNTPSLATDLSQATKKRWIPPLPKAYQTTAVYLALLGLVGTLAVYCAQGSKLIFQSMGVNYSISATIFGLLFGLIGGELGLLQPKSLQSANVFGFFLIGSFVGVIGGLLNSTPQEVLAVVVPIAALLLIGIIGIAVVSIIAGKMLGKSWEISFAIGLNCLLGFPLNFLLANEAIKAVTKDDDEQDYLSNKLVPTMMVAGFTTTTIGSVIFASIMKNML